MKLSSTKLAAVAILAIAGCSDPAAELPVILDVIECRSEADGWHCDSAPPNVLEFGGGLDCWPAGDGVVICDVAEPTPTPRGLRA